MRFIRVRAVIAHGEAAFVIMGMMSPMLRHKAYVARRVTAEVQEVCSGDAAPGGAGGFAVAAGSSFG